MANVFVAKIKDILGRLEALKNSIEKKGGIKGEVSKGVDILSQMASIKQDVYSQYKKSHDQPKMKQIIAIIQNQISLLEYYKKTALPELMGDVTAIKVDLQFNTVPIANNLLTKMLNALEMAEEKIDPQIQILNAQMAYAQRPEQDMFERSLDSEIGQINNFKAQFAEILSPEYRRQLDDYVSQLRQLTPAVLKTGGRVAFLALLPTAVFASTNQGPSFDPVHDFIVYLVLLPAALYLLFSLFGGR